MSEIERIKRIGELADQRAFTYPEDVKFLLQEIERLQSDRHTFAEETQQYRDQWVGDQKKIAELQKRCAASESALELVRKNHSNQWEKMNEIATERNQLTAQVKALETDLETWKKRALADLQDANNLKDQLKEREAEIERLTRQSKLDSEEIAHKWKLLETASEQKKAIRAQRDAALECLRKIATPRIGGKEQQYAAQAFLKDHSSALRVHQARLAVIDTAKKVLASIREKGLDATYDMQLEEDLAALARESGNE